MKNFLVKLLILTTIAIHSNTVWAQWNNSDIFTSDDDDLNVGGDIFTDFTETVEDTQATEDERFYRYGRFFTFNVGLGLTTFDGNRGIAYDNLPPSYGLSFTFFSDFQNAFGIGFEYSKHSMFLESATQGFPESSDAPGMVNISMMRVFFSYRYYIDTFNLGTAITYSNPYFIGRLEYWYVTNKYVDMPSAPNDNGGALGAGLGFGLEFPIVVKESYLNLEFLFHSVAFHDKNTRQYSPQNAGEYGFENLGGNGYSVFLNYVFNW